MALPPFRLLLAAAHLAMIPLVAGVILLSLCVYIRRKWKLSLSSVRYNLLLELGVSLVVAAVVVWCVDLTVSKYEEQQLQDLRDSIRDATLTTKLEPKVGQRVAAELRRQVIDQPIQYENYDLEGRLTYEVGANSSDPHLSCILRTSFDVVNLSSGLVMYPFQNKIAAVSPGRSVGFRLVRFSRGDLLIVDLSGPELEREIGPLNGGSDIGFRIPVRLEPSATYHAYVEKTVTFDLTDYYNIRTLYACSGMKLSLWYPSDRVSMEGSYLFPPLENQARIDTSSSQVRASVASTLLPHQGILLVWRERQ